MTDKIQWHRAKYWDSSYNPIEGCIPISPACAHCYAKSITERFGHSFAPHRTKKCNPPKKGIVFCGNMTDLFGSFVSDRESEEFVRKTLGNRNAFYLWLTKRPASMCRVLQHGENVPKDDPDVVNTFRDEDFSNQLFGFTAENQEWYDRRITDWKRECVRFVGGWLSAEPLLGKIDLGFDKEDPNSIPFKWIVVGCESGTGRRKCKIEWIESIVEQAEEVGVPVFVKQLDINGKCERDISRFPEHLRIRRVPWFAGKEKCVFP